jgi:hypothetical protein
MRHVARRFYRDTDVFLGLSGRDFVALLYGTELDLEGEAR